MDLNEIIALGETQNREVEFVIAGHHTGLFLELRHESDPEVQKVMSRFQAQIRNLTVKRKGSQQYDDLMERYQDDLRIAHVAGWRWEKGESKNRPPFSKKELKELLDKPKFGFFLKEFIDDHVGETEDFLPKSDGS